MKSRMYLITALICLAGLSPACSRIDKTTPDPTGNPQGIKSTLEGTHWELFAYRKSSLIEGTQFTLSFEADQVSGNAGCNRYFGSYSLEEDRISFSALGMTEMACMEPDGLMDQEQHLLAFLGEIERYELDEGHLYLIRADGEALSFIATSE